MLKPGGLFLSYEWVSTKAFDPNNPEHVRIIDEINFGNGLPEMRTWQQAEEAGKAAGMELVTSIDLATASTVAAPWQVGIGVGFVGCGSGVDGLPRRTGMAAWVAAAWQFSRDEGGMWTLGMCAPVRATMRWPSCARWGLPSQLAAAESRHVHGLHASARAGVACVGPPGGAGHHQPFLPRDDLCARRCVAGAQGPEGRAHDAQECGDFAH